MEQRNTEARREMLIERRFRQRAREAGFTPMPNKRLNKAIQEHFAVLLAADIARRNGRGTPDVAELQKEAVQIVARTLPPPGFKKRTLYRYRPTKNDSPAYRQGSAA